MMRFVNDLETHNLMNLYIPYNNRWNTIYITTEKILKGTELSINYGENYWKTRTRI
jgi:hypothetical protein